MIQIDMEKPNHCLHCPMCNGNDDCILIQEINTSWDWEEQYANCPLQEVEPKRKKGHWVYYDEYAEAVTHTCSECGKRMTTAIGVKASYCWNCGADMKEPFTIPTEIIESVIGYDD